MVVPGRARRARPGQQRGLRSPCWGRDAERGGSRNGPDWKEGRGQALSAAPSTTPFQARPARPGGARRRARRSRTGGPGWRVAPASSAAGPGDGSHAAASRPAPRPTCPCVRRPLHLRRWSAPKEPAVGEGGRTGLKPGVTRGTLDATSAWRLTAHSPGRHSDKAPSPRGPPSSPCLRDVRGPEERGPRDDTGHQQPRLPADAVRWWPVAPGSEHSLRSGARNGPLGGAVEPGKGSVSGRPGQPRPGQCGAGWGSGRQWPRAGWGQMCHAEPRQHHHLGARGGGRPGAPGTSTRCRQGPSTARTRIARPCHQPSELHPATQAH